MDCILLEKINEQRKIIEELENKINEMKIKDEINQFIIALNDISIYFSLEQTTGNISFKYLKEDSKVHHHYIDRLSDSGEMMMIKIKIGYDKIINMREIVRIKIDELYPNLLNDILLELNKKIPFMNSFSPLKDELYLTKRIEYWWN